MCVCVGVCVWVCVWGGRGDESCNVRGVLLYHVNVLIAFFGETVLRSGRCASPNPYAANETPASLPYLTTARNPVRGIYVITILSQNGTFPFCIFWPISRALHGILSTHSSSDTHGKLPQLVDIMIEYKIKLFVSAVGVPPDWMITKLHAAVRQLARFPRMTQLLPRMTQLFPRMTQLFPRRTRLFATPCAPGDILYVLPVLIGWGSIRMHDHRVLTGASRCCDRCTSSGHPHHEHGRLAPQRREGICMLKAAGGEEEGGRGTVKCGLTVCRNAEKVYVDLLYNIMWFFRPTRTPELEVWRERGGGVL